MTAEFVLLKNSIITGAVGLVFLVSTLVGRPLTLSATKSFQPERAAEIDEQYRTNPGARHAHRLSSAVWGAGLLLEALVRVPLIYALPISVMVGVSEVLTVVTFGALIGWSVWYARRARPATEPLVTAGGRSPAAAAASAAPAAARRDGSCGARRCARRRPPW